MKLTVILAKGAWTTNNFGKTMDVFSVEEVKCGSTLHAIRLTKHSEIMLLYSNSFFVDFFDEKIDKLISLIKTLIECQK